MKAQKPKPRKTVRDCALSLLEYRDRTEQELSRKLAERGYEPEEIQEVLSFLKEYHYVDDEAYTRRYIRAASSRKSIRQIRQDLMQKGVDRETLDVGFEEAAVDEEELIRSLLRKKGYQPGERMEEAAYRKMMASLSRKGFSFDAVRRAMDGMGEEPEW